jgi:hypothetical protein|tara:strand:- start:1603 stop:2151 length:549 start_codon:yes stop_codon:yes gene_type:complete
MNHLNEISDLLHVYPNFLAEEVCNEIVEYSEKRPNIFRDRSKEYVNRGVDGDVGNYYAAEISRKSLVPLWKKYFKDLRFKEFAPVEVQINKYDPGAFIPPHVDNSMAFHTICVPLQTDPDNCLIFGDKEVYHNNININEAEKEEKIKVFKDKKGYGYHFEGMKPVHWVPPVTSKRYSLVIIF